MRIWKLRSGLLQPASPVSTAFLREGRNSSDAAWTQDDGLDLPQQACWRCFMIKAGLSPTRLRRKVLALCAEANYVGDLISELADEARDQQKVLLLSRDEPTESPSKRLAPRSLATSSRLMRARRTDDVTLTLQPSVCPRPRRAMMHDSAPRLVTTADLGARLAAVNWFAVKAVLGVLVRSLQSAKSPTGASDDSERTRDQ